MLQPLLFLVCICKQSRTEPPIAKGSGESTARLVTPGGCSHQTCFGEESRALILGPFAWFCSSASCCPALPEHSKANVFPFNLFCLSKSLVLPIRGARKAFSDRDVSRTTGSQTDWDNPGLGCSGAGTGHCLVTPCSHPVSPIALSSALLLAPSGAQF